LVQKRQFWQAFGYSPGWQFGKGYLKDTPCQIASDIGLLGFCKICQIAESCEKRAKTFFFQRSNELGFLFWPEIEKLSPLP
jgi:hypothetical protein